MIKFCNAIGMFTVNRPRNMSCKHATAFCRRACYHAKFERLYARHRPALEAAEEEYWQSFNGARLNYFFSTRYTRPTHRFRFMSRGEAIAEMTDIPKIVSACLRNLDTLFMLPTRAWRRPELLEAMKTEFEPLKNLRLLFSTDPDCYQACLKVISEHMPHPLIARVNLTYFGDNAARIMAGAFKCPKTWDKDSDITCINCEEGCFKEDPERLKVIYFKRH